MDTENKSIHEFDYNLICSFFAGMKRQGPGSDACTRRALEFIMPLPANSTIADLGCGTGTQTLEIARNCNSKIIAEDLFPQFVQQLNSRIADEGFGNRVVARQGDMGKLSFEPESLDVIWSEGAIYNVGFEHGLSYWKQFLKPEGFVVVSEASWFTNERPAPIEEYWNDAYPEIDTVANKVAVMQNLGYKVIATFALPKTCWTKEFYEPAVEVHKRFLEQNSGNQMAEALVAAQQHEAQMYAQYGDYYGYVFYIGQK